LFLFSLFVFKSARDCRRAIAGLHGANRKRPENGFSNKFSNKDFCPAYLEKAPNVNKEDSNNAEQQ